MVGFGRESGLETILDGFSGILEAGRGRVLGLVAESGNWWLARAGRKTLQIGL